MTCKHTQFSTSEPLCFFGPVNPRDPNRPAHGGVRYRDTCEDCGAGRERLVNSRHEEVGNWAPPQHIARVRALGDVLPKWLRIQLPRRAPQTGLCLSDTIKVSIRMGGEWFDLDPSRVDAILEANKQWSSLPDSVPSKLYAALAKAIEPCIRR